MHIKTLASRSGLLKGMCLLLVLFLDLPSAQRLTQTSFPASGELVVKVLAGADLRITGHDREEVDVVAQTDHVLTAADWGWLNRDEQGILTLEKAVQGEIQIRVPQGVRLVVESHAGAVYLDGLKGTVAGRMACGSLTLVRLSGVMDLRSDCGDVRVIHCQAIGQVVASDGLLWSEDVSPDLVLKGEFGGSRILVSKAGGSLKLDSHGTDLWVSSRWGKGAVSVRADDGFVQVDAAGRPLALEVRGGGFEVTEAGKNVELNLANGRGRLSISNKVDNLKNWHLKCVDAVLTLLDPNGLIGAVMLSLQENKDGSRNHFLGLPFDTMTNVKKSSTMQLRRLPAGAGIKTELRFAAFILPSVELDIKNRRKK